MFDWFIAIGGMLTLASAWCSHLKWLRLATVAVVFANLAFGVMGVHNAPRAAMIQDHDLMVRTVTYIDAYRAGLTAGHSVAMAHIPRIFFSGIFLSILSIVPLQVRS